MATNLDIDNKLLEEAMKLGRYTTKRAVVIEALQESVQRRNQAEIIDLFGTVPYDDDHDYKDYEKAAEFFTPVVAME